MDEEDRRHLVGDSIISQVVVIHHGAAVKGRINNCTEPLLTDGTAVVMLRQKRFDGAHADVGVHNFYIEIPLLWVSDKPEHEVPMGSNVGLQVRLRCEERADELT